MGDRLRQQEELQEFCRLAANGEFPLLEAAALDTAKAIEAKERLEALGSHFNRLLELPFNHLLLSKKY